MKKNNTPRRLFFYASRQLWRRRRTYLAVFAVSVVLLALVMAAELCVAGFKYPGFLRKKNGGGIVSGPEKPLNAEAGSEIARSPDEYNALLLDYLGMTKEDLADYLENPVEVTEENSPGNPAFIEVGFTKEEYDGAKTLTAPVSRENPEADFPEFGIHVDMKWWNLDNEEDTLIVKRLPDKTDPATGAQQPVPRHREINEHLARHILRILLQP